MWFSLQRVSSGRYSASRSSPLLELNLPLEYYPVKPSRSAAADWLLSWALFPYSTLRIAGPLNAGLPTRYVPPSGFGYPLDGLLPSIPCRFFFTPAALMGFTLRSFLLPEGIRIITIRNDPLTVLPSSIPAAEAPGRPDRPRFLGFNPSGSTSRSDEVLDRRPPVTPLGFTLLGSSRESLDRDFAQYPLTRFINLLGQHHLNDDALASLPASQSIYQLPPDPDRAAYLRILIGQGDPFRVLAPAQSRTLRRIFLRVMRSPLIVSCITAD
jgi:hypothetical protein